MSKKTPATGSTLRAPLQISRKQFNSFLYDLYKCEGKNDVKADATYNGEDFAVEVFLNSPDGLLIAVHHSFAGFNYQAVDVLRPGLDSVTSSEVA